MTHRALPFLPSVLKWGVMPVILTQNQCAETQESTFQLSGTELPWSSHRSGGATRTWECSLDSQDNESSIKFCWTPLKLPSTGGLTVCILSSTCEKWWVPPSFLQPRLSLGSHAPRPLCSLHLSILSIRSPPLSSKYKVNITPLRGWTSNPSLDPGLYSRFPELAPSLSPLLQSSLWNPLEPNHRSLYMTIVMTIIPYHATQSALGSAVAPNLPKPMHILWFPFYSIPCATE